MGKYPPSALRMGFSDWHYYKCNPISFGMDIDFIETKKEGGHYKPIAILEIQRLGDKLPDQSHDVYVWLLKTLKIPIFIVETNERFEKFKVQQFGTQKVMHFSEEEMIKWLDNDLRGYKSKEIMKEINWHGIYEARSKRPKIKKGKQKGLGSFNF